MTANCRTKHRFRPSSEWTPEQRSLHHRPLTREPRPLSTLCVMITTTVPSMLSSQALQMKQSKSPSRPFKNDGDSLTLCSSLPALPDVVLCSALSTSILHGQRVYRERRRHKAAVQTRGRENLEQLEVEDMMEPLGRILKDIHTTVSKHPDPAREENIPSLYLNKRRRTTSTSSATTATPATTATKLSLVSSVATTSYNIKKDSLTIEDTPEGVFNGLKNLFKKVFAN